MIIQNENQWLAYALVECLQGATPIPFDSEAYRLPTGTKPVVQEAKSWTLLPALNWFTLENQRVSIEVYATDAKIMCKRLDYEFYGYPYSKTTSNKPDKIVTSDLIKIVNRLIEKGVSFQPRPEDRETFRISPNTTGINRDEILFVAVLGNIVHGSTNNNGTAELAFKTQRSAVLQQLGQGLEEMMLLTEILRLAKTVIFDQEKSTLDIQFAKRLPASLKEWIVKVPLLNIATLVVDGQSLQYNRTNSTMQHLLTIVSIIKYLNLEAVLQIIETQFSRTSIKETEMDVKEVPSALKPEYTTIPEGFIPCCGQPVARVDIEFDPSRAVRTSSENHPETRIINALPSAIKILTEFKENFKPESSNAFTPEFYAHALAITNRSVPRHLLRNLSSYNDSSLIALFRTISPDAERFIIDGTVKLDTIAEFVQVQEKTLSRFFAALHALTSEPNPFYRPMGSGYRLHLREEQRDRNFPIFTRDRDALERDDRRDRNYRANQERRERAEIERQERRNRDYQANQELREERYGRVDEGHTETIQRLDRMERNHRANQERREREAQEERGIYRGSRGLGR